MHEESVVQSDFAELTLFKPASWQTKIDFINHLVLFNNVLIAVLAEKAGGKTAFAHFLQEQLDSQIKNCLINVQAPFDPQLLINTIADTLHLKQETESPLTMPAVVRQINERKAPVLLIIDNAQNLPESWVKDMLQEIQNQKENPWFHLALISDFSVVASYNALTREDVHNSIHSIELGTLSENETKTYALHKAALMKKALGEAQLQHLYKMTGGCMAQINSHLASNFMETRSSGKYWPNLKYIAMAASFAFVAMGISWFTWTKESESASLTTANIEYKSLTSLASSLPNWQEGQRTLVYQELPKQQILAMLDENDIQDQNKAVVEEIVVIPNINVNKTVNVSEKMQPSFIHPVEKKAGMSGGDQQRSYTIQLLASHHISDIHKFIQLHALQGKSAIRQVTRQNDSWYILTVGEYSSSEQANVAAHDLSLKFGKTKPWVRLTANLKLVG